MRATYAVSISAPPLPNDAQPATTNAAAAIDNIIQRMMLSKKPLSRGAFTIIPPGGHCKGHQPESPPESPPELPPESPPPSLPGVDGLVELPIWLTLKSWSPILISADRASPSFGCAM